MPLKQPLGRSLLRSKHKTQANFTRNTGKTSEATGVDAVHSITEESSLETILRNAELAGMKFTAEKMPSIVRSSRLCVLPTLSEQKKTEAARIKCESMLRIPRRPQWDAQTTPEELRAMEYENFLDWRRKLAILEDVDEICLTPFEKNLDFWRQLWRVIERSDVVIQILDARNPLLFRCKDLEEYTILLDSNKRNVLLLNKADYLTPELRKQWCDYFDSIDTQILFYSAISHNSSTKDAEDGKIHLTKTHPNPGQKSLNLSFVSSSMKKNECQVSDPESESEVIGTNAKEMNEHMSRVSRNDQNDDEAQCDYATLDEEYNLSQRADLTKENVSDIQVISELEAFSLQPVDDSRLQSKRSEASDTHIRNRSEILSPEQLIEWLKEFCSQSFNKSKSVIGLVGYPNVGKSSTINSLLHCKKVPVSATPGKTKHFQTLKLSDELTLCDCPGLVFPSFTFAKGELILNGILPVDQMREFIEPIAIMCQQIKRSVFEEKYGLKIQRWRKGDHYFNAHELCDAYATARNIMSHKNVPNRAEAARFLIKNYINGSLIYCHQPPNSNLPENCDEDASENRSENERKEIRFKQELQKSIESSLKAKQPSLPGHNRHSLNSEITIRCLPKKHYNRNKHVKLRNKFASVDIHIS